jgi:hypothetical protein
MGTTISNLLRIHTFHALHKMTTISYSADYQPEIKIAHHHLSKTSKVSFEDRQEKARTIKPGFPVK